MKKQNDSFDDTIYRKAAKTSLLKREEERDLISRAHQGDHRALNRMVRSNIRLVFRIAGRFAHRGLDYEDLVQQGMLGLVRAVEKFELTNQVKFSTYAVWWIKHYIRRALENESRSIRIPVHRATACDRIMKTLYKRALLSGHQPTVADVAEQLGIGETETAVIMHQRSGHDLSLEHEIDSDGGRDGSNAVTYKNVIPDESLMPEDRTDSARTTSRASEILVPAMSVLTPRERHVIECRIIKDPGDTLIEIGKRFGVSRERIRQIEMEALEKMRRRLVSLGLAEECATILDLFETVADRQGYGGCVERASQFLGPLESAKH